MNKYIWGVVVIVVLGGAFYFYTKKAETASASTIKIGAALGMTGFCDTWGTGEDKAIRLAVDEANAAGGINGKQIEVITEDNACDGKTTVSAVQKLINADHVVAVVGPTWGDSFQGAATLFNQNKIISVSPSEAMEALELNKVPTDYMFSTWFPQKSEIDALQTQMQKMGKKKIAILHDDDPFGIVVMNLFKAGAPAHGIVIVDEETFPSGYDDFRTSITKVKALNPDGVFTSFLMTPTKGKFLKQAHDLGFNVQFFSTTDIQEDSLLEQFGPTLNGIVYTFAEVSGDKDTFTKNFTAKYKTAPSGPSVTNAYDATRALIAALADHEKNGTDMKTAMERVKVSGVTVPTIHFNADHQITDVTFKIKMIKDEQFVDVK